MIEVTEIDDVEAAVADREEWPGMADTLLLEGEIDRALALLTDPRSVYLDPVIIARAAEETRPQAAIEIYRKRIREFIEARGRGNYAAAASLLLRVRNLHAEIGDTAGWDQYFRQLCSAYHGRTALKDELARAGLRCAPRV